MQKLLSQLKLSYLRKASLHDEDKCTQYKANHRRHDIFSDLIVECQYDVIQCQCAAPRHNRQRHDDVIGEQAVGCVNRNTFGISPIHLHHVTTTRSEKGGVQQRHHPLVVSM
jgi:hypothetical protein